MTSRTTKSTHRTRAALGFAALCALVVGIAMLGSSAGAAGTKKLGRTKHTPSANRNFVEGRVTGFQKEADGKRRLMVAKENGTLVAWAVDLAKPSKGDQDIFKSLFFNGDDTAPQARVAVLRHVDGHRYKLLRRSPAVQLKSAFGRKQVITLNKPLKIRKGNILALTIDTWLPVFTLAQPGSANRWLGSRPQKNCTFKNDTLASKRRFAQRSEPQNKVGSIRHYGCHYRGGRLLYWGYYVPR